MGTLAGKRALITGGASGIGRATALLFAREGAAITIIDIDGAGGNDVADGIRSDGTEAMFILCDVTSSSQCQQAIEQTLERLGGIDVLFNSAGVIRRATVVETSEQEWDRLMAVNVKSIFLTGKFAIPHMAQGGGGVILNVASGWGLAGGARAAAYCASKGAVVLLTKAMAIDHGPQNIRVNCICPGDTDTPMLHDEASQLGVTWARFSAEAGKRPLGRIGRPDDVAQAALFLASDASAFVTGASIVVDGGGLAGFG